MICLPDVNLWIALTSDRHIHHRVARNWLDGAQEVKLVFCRITEMGFLRLLTNSHVMEEDVLSCEEAWNIYDAWRADGRVGFLPEPSGLRDTWRDVSARISGGPNSWTDAYLAAFAIRSKTTVVTFDRRFPRANDCAIELLSAAE